jgi:O-methyltransferase involved in polyketide biosynthesis
MDRPDVTNLGVVPETLLIPLAARMIAPERHPDLGFRDVEAERIGARIGFDPGRFADDTGSMRGSVVRASWFDQIVSAFVAAHPGGLCVSIGSGLDDRPARIGLPESITWIDAEFAEVVRLREMLIAPRPNVRDLTIDGLEPGAWVNKLPWDARRPALVLGEGVTMYLAPADGQALFRSLGEAARVRSASLDLVADFASPFMVRHSRRNPSLAKTRASFTWALRRSQDVATIVPGLSLVEEADIARRCGALSWTVSRVHRLITGRAIYFAAHYRLTDFH